MVILPVTSSLAGSAFYLLVFGGLGWWWDGFFLLLLGLVLGQSIGFTVMAYVPRWKDSEGPLVLCTAPCVLLLVILWLSLPADAVRILGQVAMILVGGACGLLLGFGLSIMAMDSYAQQAKDERSGSPGGF